DFVVLLSDPSSPSSPVKAWRPVRGKYRWAMSYGDFYDAVGRPDLTRRQADRDFKTSLFTWGGLLVVVGGVYVTFRGLGEHSSTGTAIGVGLMVAGGTSTVIGVSLDNTVISEREAMQLAAGYNLSLRKRLKLSPNTSSQSAASRTPAAFARGEGTA